MALRSHHHLEQLQASPIPSTKEEKTRKSTQTQKEKEIKKGRKYYCPHKHQHGLVVPYSTSRQENASARGPGMLFLVVHAHSLTSLVSSNYLSSFLRLASTAVAIVVDVDIDGVVKVAAVFLRLFLSQSISSNNCQLLAYILFFF